MIINNNRNTVKNKLQILRTRIITNQISLNKCRWDRYNHNHNHNNNNKKKKKNRNRIY